MNLIKIDLKKEVHNMCEYEVTYEEKYIFTVIYIKNSNTFNYDGKEVENIPEMVLDLIEAWISMKI